MGCENMKCEKVLPCAGEIYRHYKGNIYKVVCVARHSETLEDMVVYEDVSVPGKIWARPASMWSETVIVNGRETARFERQD